MFILHKFKKHTLLLLLIIIATQFKIYGQVDGDYGAVKTGDWSDNNTWAIWQNGSFSISVSTTPSGNDNVYILGGKTVNITQNSNCKQLTIGSSSVTGKLQFDNNGTNLQLTINGNATIYPSSSLLIQNTGASAHSITIKGDLVNNGSINLHRSNTQTADLTINGSNISGNGSFTLDRLYLTGTDVNWSSPSTIKLFNDFYNNTSSSLNILNGSFAVQAGIGGSSPTSFYHLSISTDSVSVLLKQNVEIRGTLNMSGKGAALSLNGKNLSVKGNYSRPYTCKFIGHAHSALSLSGSSNSELLSFTTNFDLASLSIDNTTASASTYTLGDNLTIKGNLSLTGSNSPTTLLLSTCTLSVEGNTYIGNRAILQNNNTSGSSLNTNDLDIEANGTLQSYPSPTNGRSLTINVSGNLTNNGKINLWNTLSGNISTGTLNFTGSNDKTMTFAEGSSTDIASININKPGACLEMVLDHTLFTVQDGSALGFLSILSGIFKLSGSCLNFSTLPFSNPIFATADYSIPTMGTEGGFCLNNPNIRITGQNSSPTLNGRLEINQGTMDVGNSDGNLLNLGTGAKLAVNGGTLNIASQLFTTKTVDFSLSSGTINICTLKNSSKNPSFGLSSASNSISITGGTIKLVQSNSNSTGGLDYTLQGNHPILSNGTLQIGTSASLNLSHFKIQGLIPHLVVGNGMNTQTATANADCTVLGDINVQTASSLNFSSATISFQGNQTQEINSQGTIVGNSSTFILDKPSNSLLLNCPLSINSLRPNSGNMVTSNTNLLTIEGSTANDVQGGSEMSYIKGPLKRKLSPSTSSFSFPIGNSHYEGIDLQNLAVTNEGYITAQVYEIAPGGKGGTGLSEPLTADRYWSIKADNNFSSHSIGSIQLAHPNLAANDVIGQSQSATGTYNSIGGSNSDMSIQSNKTMLPILSGSENFFIATNAQTLSGDYWVGESQVSKHGNRGFYNLTDVAKALNQFKVVGDVNISMEKDYDGTTNNTAHPEVFPIQFFPYPTSSTSNKVSIQLAADATKIETSNGMSSPQTALIYFAGVNNLSFDGLNATNSERAWTFRTQSNDNNIPVFMFDKGASGNELKNIIIEGNTKSANTGSVCFSKLANTTGCNNNRLTHCSLRNRSDKTNEYPTNAVYSIGSTSAMPNSYNTIENCDIFNFGNENISSNGIQIDQWNDNWTITNNSIYQNETRHATAGALTICGITISSGSNHTLEGNHIGGSAPNCSGIPMKLADPTFNFPNTLTGIQINGGNANINNNTISNIYLESNQSDQSTGAFCGIKTSGDCHANIGNTMGNKIGDSEQLDAIITDIRGNGAYVYAIKNTSSGNIGISNNIIGGIKLPNPTAGKTSSMIGICSTAGNLKISNNQIGGNKTDNMTLGNNSASGTTNMIGIECIAPSSNIIIEKNTIRNFANKSLSASKTIGIDISSLQQSISQNTIYKLTTDYSGSVTGINSSSTNTTENTIKQNFIHSLKSGTSNPQQYGLSIKAGTFSIQNNMIRLGIDPSGNSETTAETIYGIHADSPDRCSFYYNSIYIGGTGVSSSFGKNSFAFIKTKPTADDIRNNIFTNNRSSAAANGSKHYAFQLAYPSTHLTCDYNIYSAEGIEGVLFNINSSSTDYNDLRQLRSEFKTQDKHSGIGNPYFENPIGDYSSVSLKLSTTHPTPAKGTGIILANIHEDIDDNANRTGSDGAATEIGADADQGNTYSIDQTEDIFAPVFDYHPLSNTTTASEPRTIDLEISDQSPLDGGLDLSKPPRIYFRRSSPASRVQTWNSAQSSIGILQSGDQRKGIWRFTIDVSSFLAPQQENDIIEYYFVAQDLSTHASHYNLSYSAFDQVQPQHSDVNTAILYPYNAEVNCYGISGNLPSSITIGTGGTFSSLTKSGGLFQNMNALTITDNITASIISDITEDGTYSLKKWNETTSGSNFSLTIVPDGEAVRTLDQNPAFDKDMIRIDGAQGLTFKGNASGTGKYIRLTSPKENHAVLKLENDASKNEIKGICIQGNIKQVHKGLVWIADGTTTGNEFNTITECSISGLANTYESAIYSLGTSTTALNKHNQIHGNEISNFTQYGTYLNQNGNGEGWNIINNSFFYPSAIAPNPESRVITAIHLENNGAHNITGNYIGGQEAKCEGGAWSYNANIAFRGINIDQATENPSVNLSNVQDNIIQNINLPNSGSNTSSFIGIRLNNLALLNIKNNQIGGKKAISTNNKGFCGIWINATNDGANICNNSISNITYGYTGGMGSFYGIQISSTGSNADSICANQIAGISSSSNVTHFGIYAKTGISSATALEQNTITDFCSSNTGANTDWTGIRAASGFINLKNNYVGGSDAKPMRHQGGGACTAISSTTNNTVSIENNTVKNIQTDGNNLFQAYELSLGNGSLMKHNSVQNISLSHTGTNTSFKGINLSTGLATIAENTIGGSSGSITTWGGGMNFGIYSNSSAPTICDNSISGISASGNNSKHTAGNLLLTGVHLTGGKLDNNSVSLLCGTNSTTNTHLAGITSLSTNGNVEINRNKIYNISNLSPSGTASAMLLAPNANDIKVSNNFITLGNGQASPTFNGIWINETMESKALIWNNTIVLEGLGSSQPSSAILREDVNTPIEIKNNILINNRTNSEAFILSNKNSSNWTSDYNDLSATSNWKANWIGQLSEKLSDWQAISSQDSNSICFAPVFAHPEPITSCDFHIDPNTNCNLNGMGTHLNLNTDIDKETRNPKRPDIGADEFTPRLGANASEDVWTGTLNQQWDEPQNWGCELVPLPTTNITIPVVRSKNYPEKNSLTKGSFANCTADCNKLKLCASASLTILPQQSLTIHGDFELDGTFAIESDSSGTGSFICRGNTLYGTNASVDAKRYFSNGAWHYFTPMTDQVNSSQFTNSTGYYNANLIEYNEAWSTDQDGNKRIDYMDGWRFPFAKDSPPANLSTAAKGYGIFFESNMTTSMSGQLHNGAYELPIYNTDQSTDSIYEHGFNLVGNPYPSSLNANEFLTANEGQIDGAIYLWDEYGTDGWDPLGADYAVWSKLGSVNTHAAKGNNKISPDGHIAPGQGFFVKKHHQGTGSLRFNNGMREHDRTHCFKSEENIARIKIGVSNPQRHYNEVLVAMRENGCEAGDTQGEISKIKGNKRLSFFTIRGKKHLAIQAFSHQTLESIEEIRIPLGLEQTIAGKYTFNIAWLENFDPQVNIFFRDKERKKTVRLEKTGSPFYEVSLPMGKYLNRFELIFTRKKRQDASTDKETIQAFQKDKTIQLNIELADPNPIKGVYTIFDISGKTIATNIAENNSSYSIPIPTTGVYLLKLQIGGKIYTQKILTND